MLERIIDFSLRRRGFIAFGAVVLAALGIWSAFRVSIDAVPDITNPQVQINTAVGALAPEEIESLVTVPIEIEMAGVMRRDGRIERRGALRTGHGVIIRGLPA